jgi:hypothetical protein
VPEVVAEESVLLVQIVHLAKIVMIEKSLDLIDVLPPVEMTTKLKWKCYTICKLRHLDSEKREITPRLQIMMHESKSMYEILP